MKLTEAMWPHLRAFLVAVHVFAVTVMAMPAPGGGMNRSAWKDPTVQAEFDVWHARLAAIGVAGEREAFEDDLYGWAKWFMDGRTTVLKPFGPYYTYFGTFQSWRMFVAPHTHPSRMHVDIEENGVWRPIYVERSSEHTWNHWKLDYDRTRSIVFRYAWGHYRKHYQQFADWIAVEAERDFPDATRVRVRFYKAKSPTPEQARSGNLPEGKFEHTLNRNLE